MPDILHDLRLCDLRGVVPPQDWTTRAADEIERLRAALAAPAASEPLYWQWRPKNQSWSLERTFNHQVHATTPGSEVRALYAAPAAPSVPQWQPIETAPKGRILLVGYTNRAGKWRTVRGRYYEAETLESEMSEDGWAPEGWYEEADNAEEINFTDEPPTHWMPLPAAPTDGGQGHG